MPQFPGWNHSREFVNAFRSAVRTRSRLHKRGPKYPPIVLRTGPDEARQALQALEASLKRSSATGGSVPCTMYAHPDWAGGTRAGLIAAIAAEFRRNAPTEAGRLRLPAYDLLRNLADGELSTEELLADRVYARHRGRETAALPPREGNDTTITAFFVAVPLHSLRWLGELVYRGCWQWRWGYRLTRRRRYQHLWPDGFDGGRGYATALEQFENARTDPDRWDGLLLAALMTDLYTYAGQGLLHPGRRRRRPRHVLLLDGTADGAQDSVASLITLYGRQQQTSPNAVMVLVAALPPEPGVAPEPDALSEAAKRLNPAKGEVPEPFHVPLPTPAATPHTVPGVPVWIPWVRVRPRVELTFQAVALVSALWLSGQLAVLPYVGPWIGDGPLQFNDCPTGSDSKQQVQPTSGDEEALYTKALELIEEETTKVEKGDEQRTVTLAHVRSLPSENADERRTGGSIPELRGIYLAQKALRGKAGTNDSAVRVRIESYDAGVQFEQAEKAAKQIIEDADEKRILGVVGFTESRKSTKAALHRLNQARMPIVTTTASAQAMEVGRHVHGLAPNNEREAHVVANFVTNANTIRTGEDSCKPARKAAVVTDPSDLYSKELASEFRDLYKETGEPIGYTPRHEDDEEPSNAPGHEMTFDVSALAAAVCSRVHDEPRTLVYWTSRVREFAAFLEEYEGDGDCANKDLTVVGGNELTNAALTGSFQEKSWLHLYHTAHVLPYKNKHRNSVARKFHDAYVKKFGEDRWLNDGHVALAHDAVQVFAEAASDFRRARAGSDLDREDVQAQFNQGTVDLEGASGHIRFTEKSPLRSSDKLLVMLYYGDKGPAPVLVCGSSGNGIDAGKQWEQGHTTYDCPQDAP